jgi:beta-glucosidase
MDRDSLALPGDQDALVSAVAAANPRTVVVLNTPGPVLMPWLDEVAAVLQVWYPGEQFGTALAAVLFGDDDPAGRLPVTFPASPDQGPGATPETYPGRRSRALRRGSAGRLPLLRRPRSEPAVPVRARPVVRCLLRRPL